MRAISWINVQRHTLERRFDGSFKEKFCKAAPFQKSVRQAAASIIICGSYERVVKKYGKNAEQYIAIEAGCAGENVSLQASSCGLGTVIVCGFDPKAVQKILDIPTDEHPLCILPLGKPASEI